MTATAAVVTGRWQFGGISPTARQDECFASVDLWDDWRMSYLKVMGIQPRLNKPPPIPPQYQLRLTNLLTPRDDADETIDTEISFDSTLDGGDSTPTRSSSGRTTTTPTRRGGKNPSRQWIATALEMQANIDRMAQWIGQKKMAYVSVEMPEEEASLIQSTVTSFTVTTANEIESLRKLISSSSSSSEQQQSATNNNATTGPAAGADSPQLQQHKTAIVQILLARLKEEIAEPFGLLQKQRSRCAIRLWQHPLECSFVPQHGQEQEQKFMPHRPSHRLHMDFLKSYQQDENLVPLERPTSALLKNQRKRPSPFTIKEEEQEGEDEDEEQKSAQPEDSIVAPPQAKLAKVSNSMPNDLQLPTLFQAQDQEFLQQEAVLLTASLQNDLDSVQKVEQMMVDITSLLSQFAELVSEQQEEITEIHDATAMAKENVTKGKEELVTAAEKTQQSSHYMAKSITLMAFLLLLFHLLRP